MKKALWLIGILILLQSPVWAKNSISKELIFVGQDLEPFYFKEGSAGIQGATYDVMKQICDLENLHCKFKIANFRPALDMVRSGSAHGGGPFIISAQRESVLYYTEPVFKSSFVLLGHPEVVKDIKSLTDLSGLSIGTMAPSMEWVSLQRINEFTGNKITVGSEPTELTAIRKVENKNYALAYVSRESAQSYFLHNRTPLQEIPNMGETFDLHLTFSKKAVSQKDFERIQKALRKIKSTEAFKGLADKYKIQTAD